MKEENQEEAKVNDEFGKRLMSSTWARLTFQF